MAYGTGKRRIIIFGIICSLFIAGVVGYSIVKDHADLDSAVVLMQISFGEYSNLQYEKYESLIRKVHKTGYAKSYEESAMALMAAMRNLEFDESEAVVQAANLMRISNRIGTEYVDTALAIRKSARENGVTISEYIATIMKNIE